MAPSVASSIPRSTSGDNGVAESPVLPQKGKTSQPSNHGSENTATKDSQANDIKEGSQLSKPLNSTSTTPAGSRTADAHQPSESTNGSHAPTNPQTSDTNGANAPEGSDAAANEAGDSQTPEKGDSASADKKAGDEKGNTSTPGNPNDPKPKETVATQPTAATILANRPFILKAHLLTPGAADAAPTVEATGSVLSQTLEKDVLRPPTADASTLTLGIVRKLIGPMSSFARIHKFCTPSGTLVNDESLTLVEYFALEPEASPGPATNVPSLKLYYRSPSTNPIGTGGQNTGTTATAPTISTQLTDGSAGLKAELKAATLTSAIKDDPFTKVDDVQGAGKLTEEQWGTVLRNCAVFYGWIVDPKTRRIGRAPKAAFQLRSTIETLEPETETTSTKTLTSDAKPAESSSQRSLPSAKPEDAPSSGSGGGTSQEAELEADKEARSKREAAAKEIAEAEQEQARAPVRIQPKTDKAIPNFRVNDDSKIDITVCKHELALSMAKNDFSSQSTEASVSGGFGGITAGVSAGYASSESQAHKTSSTTATQTMVARYMYPRCDLFLYSSDLEPTPEFATLLEKVRRYKDIRALKKLQSEYGQLFSQQLTLGARLLATKVMSSDEKASEDESKEQFKVSVGVSVSTPYGGASVKHEQSKGKEESEARSEKTSSESNVFEAVGGNTILANNPNEWASSVAASDTWRVINRDGLTPLVDMLADMPGYSAVHSWYVQAVPALSRYVNLDASKQVICRFKVQSPTNSLMKRNDGRSTHYLGFHPKFATAPLQGNLAPTGQTMDFFWLRMEIKEQRRLFQPMTYRAPGLFGFEDFKIADSMFGANYSEDFAAVTWNIVAPFTDVLSHGCRIVMQTVPYRDPSIVLNPGDVDPTPPPSHMVVFRNAQGEFLPAMSDNDEFQYWRLLKVGGKQDEPIRAGDDVRLCWYFKDQTTGFRDYLDDVFGRRQTRAMFDNSANDTLYLKVPWPRFENEGLPTGMIMSPESGLDQCLAKMKTRSGEFDYMYQDVKFRLDTVENSGRGDANDYLLKNVAQDGDVQKLFINGVEFKPTQPSPAPDPFQMVNKMLAFGVR